MVGMGGWKYRSASLYMVSGLASGLLLVGAAFLLTIAISDVRPRFRMVTAGGLVALAIVVGFSG